MTCVGCHRQGVSDYKLGGMDDVGYGFLILTCAECRRLGVSDLEEILCIFAVCIFSLKTTFVRYDFYLLLHKHMHV